MPTALLRISDEFDLGFAMDFSRSLIDRELSSVGQVVVDLSDVDFVDSADVAMLIAGYNDARLRDVRFGLAGLQPQVGRALRHCGLDRLVAVYPSLEVALHELSSE